MPLTLWKEVIISQRLGKTPTGNTMSDEESKVGRYKGETYVVRDEHRIARQNERIAGLES
jgi:hypothetical protein